ncbi:MAG: excinuclease ABC subunit UvrA, partial [Planctomycetes bacterium]|nr:excinuclease ABC subunit UvrA [Planctomycetota bacterium]
MHNLQGIDLDLPRNRLIVVTGLSGSGKSSLAFDTIYAEGQRRYVESLSAYARQFLGQREKPDVDSIEGLPPTIAIEQRASSHNPRSTVATTTEIYDYLRVLYARAGIPHCPKCGREIRKQSAQEIADRLIARGGETPRLVLAPVVRGRKGEHREVFRSLASSGFLRARVDGTVRDLGEIPKLAKRSAHTIEAVVDRLTPTEGRRARLQEAVELALKVGEGVLRVLDEAHGEEEVYSAQYACPDCGVAVEEIEPRMFSFNSPYGACPGCDGLGNSLEFDADLVVPDPSKSIEDGAIRAWRLTGRRNAIHTNRLLRQFSRAFGVPLDVPFRDLPDAGRRTLLEGTPDGSEPFFEGVLPNLQRRFRQTDSEYVKHRLMQFMSERPCRDCKGARLRPVSLAVRVAGRSILETSPLPVDGAHAFLAGLSLEGEAKAVAAPIVRELLSRLKFLRDVGLGYLTLDRRSDTLSGGEAQRIRLATQVGSGLVGVCYVLDEPTIGLHPRDNARLLETLRAMRDLGNTVILVEHDEETIRSADWVVDLGPGAGRMGGRLVAQGTPAEIERDRTSCTGRYLSGAVSIPVPARRRPRRDGAEIVVRGARENNLKGIDVRIPLGLFTCVTGVSGSGKSTLVYDILDRAARRSLSGGREKPGLHDRIEGLRGVDQAISIDQSPIGRTPRSNAATYTGALDAIRKLFAGTLEAKVRGYGPARFSFNLPGGRCEACEGQGQKCLAMHFLPDVYVTCELCRGTRFNRETLQVRWRGRTIAEVLQMPVEEAAAFFKNAPTLPRILGTLLDVGLGYLHLGQPSTTLSG